MSRAVPEKTGYWLYLSVEIMFCLSLPLLSYHLYDFFSQNLMVL